MFQNWAITHTLLLWRTAPFRCQNSLQPHVGIVGCVFPAAPWGPVGRSSIEKKTSPIQKQGASEAVPVPVGVSSSVVPCSTAGLWENLRYSTALVSSHGVWPGLGCPPGQCWSQFCLPVQAGMPIKILGFVAKFAFELFVIFSVLWLKAWLQHVQLYLS